jgi:hypothetical protein
LNPIFVKSHLCFGEHAESGEIGILTDQEEKYNDRTPSTYDEPNYLIKRISLELVPYSHFFYLLNPLF